MAEPATTLPKVPSVLTCRVNELDKPVVADLMSSTGITDSTQLVRYCLRAAQRELVANGAPSKNAKNHHRSAASKG